ncbi:serine hydroxymethyltransferase, partial [Candidatus Margulisiibacteriota bacterium]
ALTTRGMKENEMKVIADLIGKVLSNVDDEKSKKEAAAKVKDLCKQFPLYS